MHIVKSLRAYILPTLYILVNSVIGSEVFVSPFATRFYSDEQRFSKWSANI